MKLFHIILSVAIGALIGYCTNYIAIKMLFLPRKELWIGKWKVPFTPGVIPKNKKRIAAAVGNAVNDKLLTENDIAESVKKSNIKEEIVNRITNFVMADETSLESIIALSGADTEEISERISCLLGEKILNGIKKIDMNTAVSNIAQGSFSELLSNPMISMLFGGNMMDSFFDKLGTAVTQYIDENGQSIVVPMVKQEVDTLLSGPLKSSLDAVNITESFIRRETEQIADRLIGGSMSELTGSVNIKNIVEEKINDMDVKDLEDLVMSVMKNELQAVVNLGAVIGAVIGIVNIFI